MKRSIGVLGFALLLLTCHAAAWGAQPKCMLHVSDLFRPHNDPDDHWDLACAYALAHQGQAEILPHLSDRVQNFFAYMYRHGRTLGPKSPPPAAQADWLQYLTGPKETDLLARQGQLDRNMWCTGGFLHAVGLTVTVDGQIVSLAEAKNPVYTFEPIRVDCLPSGVTHWTPDPKSTDRFIFRVVDPGRYASAMTAAMRSLLTRLP